MKNSKWIPLLLVLPYGSALGQIVTSAGSVFAGGESVISINCSMSLPSQADLGKSHLVIKGDNLLLASSAPLSVDHFTLEAQGEIEIIGDWTIARQIDFFNGILTPVEPSGKINYSGIIPVEGSENSFVNGLFYHIGSGTRLFPVGTIDSGYHPAMLAGADGRVGIRYFDTDPQIALPQTDTDLTVFTSGYWNVTSSAGLAARIGLSLNGISIAPGSYSLTVLEAEKQGGMAVNLGTHSISDEFVFSYKEIASDRIYAIASSSDQFIKVRNVITPNNDEENDILFIEHIAQFPENKVIMIDRWGAKVHEWHNYSNSNPAFDFSKLSAGNYVCLVEYSTPTGKKSLAQMVTILK